MSCLMWFYFYSNAVIVSNCFRTQPKVTFGSPIWWWWFPLARLPLEQMIHREVPEEEHAEANFNCWRVCEQSLNICRESSLSNQNSSGLTDFIMQFKTSAELKRKLPCLLQHAQFLEIKSPAKMNFLHVLSQLVTHVWVSDGVYVVHLKAVRFK